MGKRGRRHRPKPEGDAAVGDGGSGAGATGDSSAAPEVATAAGEVRKHVNKRRKEKNTSVDGEVSVRGCCAWYLRAILCARNAIDTWPCLMRMM